MNQVWTKVEEQFVCQNANKITDAEGARQLSQMTGRNITVNAWRKKRQQLGLRKDHGRGVCRLAQDVIEKLKVEQEDKQGSEGI